MSSEWENAAPADFKIARRKPRQLNDPLKDDTLPPHSTEAEQGVLGCILLDASCFPRCEERFGGSDEAFYNLRHRAIYQAVRAVYARGAVDLITLNEELRSRKQLDEIGGLAFLMGLPDHTPSAAHIEHYLAIVREKHIARLLLSQSMDMAHQVQALGGVTEPVLARIEEFRKQFEVELHRGAVTPRYIKAAGEFGDAVWNEFFGRVSTEEPGWTLPIEFKLKWRLKEVTLVTGDDGCGKSTFLNYCCLHVGQQMEAGEKILIASFEEPPETQIWGLTVQLCGQREFPDTSDGQRRFANSMQWLHQRIYFYAFLGIADWRDVLDSFRYAAKNLGVKLFVLDSVMRIGIPDDDYATQGLFAALIAQFAIEFNVHVVLVIHENKGADKGKAKVRGSKLWTANVANVVKFERNMEKGEKLDDLWQDLQDERRLPNPSAKTIADIEKQRTDLKKKWDAHVVLLKQRRKGTQQNASKYFWFDWRTFQYREHQPDQPANWLERWAATPTRSAERGVRNEDVAENWPTPSPGGEGRGEGGPTEGPQP